MLPQAVSDLLQAQQAHSAKARAAVLSEWARMGDDLDRSWALLGPRIVTLTAAAQLGAARDGSEYVQVALEAQGTPVEPVAQFDPRSLTGVASDGRRLETLLYSAVVQARTAKVASLPQRLQVGALWLDGLVQTQIADARRDAAKVAITARPGTRWVRIVTPPCCQRCAVLAGASRTFSHEFKRHPRCDCTMLPQTVADPFAVGRRIDPADITDLTGKQRAALASSKEPDPTKALNRVINDYQRKRGQFSGYLPPTRVDKVVERAGQREKALAALREIGIVAA